jgi:hypothetical protein
MCKFQVNSYILSLDLISVFKDDNEKDWGSCCTQDTLGFICCMLVPRLNTDRSYLFNISKASTGHTPNSHHTVFIDFHTDVYSTFGLNYWYIRLTW